MESNRKGYNGWSNYETWNAALWLDNDQGSYDYWRERAQAALEDALSDASDLEELKSNAATVLAEELESEHDDACPDIGGFFGDILRAALGDVDWREIAHHYIDDFDIYSASWHFPGCLPESDPALFLDEQAAREYLAEELEQSGDGICLVEEEEKRAELEERLEAAIESVRATGAAFYAGMNYIVEKVG